MQTKDDCKVGSGAGEISRAPSRSSFVADTQRGPAEPQGGCYGIQILIAGRRKRWRDEVACQVRRAGYAATAVDSGLDALSVLVLGLPVDVLLADADLGGELGCSQLAIEARAMRPNLGIVVAGQDDDGLAECPPDAHMLPPDAGEDALTVTVREALAARVT